MKDQKTTKLTIRDDRPTGLASSAQGSNIDAIGFNVAFLTSHSPRLAVEVMKLYALAHKVKADDPQVPEEDIAMFADEIAKLLADETNEED